MIANKNTLTLLLLGLLSQAANGAQDGGIQILQTGEFHQGEVPEKVGSHWFALIADQIQSELKAVKPKITTVYDPVGDDQANKASYTGKKISVKGKAPILLVQSPRLKAGAILQANISSSSDRQIISLRGEEFTFQHKCKAAPPGSSLKPCQIFLSGNGTTQWSADADEGDDDYALSISVRWAGDLDRDGKLDLILDESTYNQSAVVLWLSSPASTGSLVVAVGRLTRTGC